MDRKLSKQIENTLVAIDMVKSLPPYLFTPRLGAWHCGSAACFGGWVMQHPYFQKQGVESDGTDDQHGEPTMMIDGKLQYGQNVSAELFDDSGLFFPRGLGDPVNGSDRTVVLERLHRTLNDLLDKT